jgi:tetratricopeptide (TPR) repeat protein
LSDAAFQRFVAMLDAQTVRPEQRLARLEELGAWLESTIAQLSRASNDDPETRGLKDRAAKALAEGDFENAVELLKAVRRTLRESRRRTEQRLQEEMLNLRSEMAEEAVATSRLAELSLARSDYDEAADLFAEAAAGAPQNDPDVEIGYRLRYADAWFRKGEDLADPQALVAAAKAYDAVAAMALKIRSAKPFAAAKRGEGSALFRLGELEPGTVRLRGAVAAWREALPHLSRPEDAIARGLLEVQIGAALAMIGERDNDTGAAGEAAVELRRALDLLPATRVPIDRATAELYLGRVLVLQSEAPGMQHMLGEAVTLFAAAAQAWSTAQQPLQWAAAQLNLGAALVRIGDVEDRRRNWTAAATAFVQALQVFEQEGAQASAEQVRGMVRQLHARLGTSDQAPALGAGPRRANGA